MKVKIYNGPNGCYMSDEDEKKVVEMINKYILERTYIRKEKIMTKREILWDNVDGDCIIWSQDYEDAEITCISGDKVIYYEPDKLLDMVLFADVMDRMKINEKDRNNIMNYIMELWDEFKINKKGENYGKK